MTIRDKAIFGALLLAVFGLVVWTAESRRPKDVSDPIPGSHVKVASGCRPTPPADWKKVYDVIQGGHRNGEVAVVLELSGENGGDYHVYLADGLKWHMVTSGGFGGCGGYVPITRVINNLMPLKGSLTGVPGSETRFEVVGTGRPVLLSAKIEYFGVKE